MQGFLMLKQVVHIVITYVKGLREKQEFHQIYWSQNLPKKIPWGTQRYDNIQIQLDENGWLVELVHYKAQWWC